MKENIIMERWWRCCRVVDFLMDDDGEWKEEMSCLMENDEEGGVF